MIKYLIILVIVDVILNTLALLISMENSRALKQLLGRAGIKSPVRGVGYKKTLTVIKGGKSEQSKNNKKA